MIAVMNRRMRSAVSLVAPLAALLACGKVASLPVAAGTGPSPALPEPRTRPLPSVYLAPAAGWGPTGAPTPAPGLAVSAFARGLAHPRWLHVLPNGDVLVAETSAPPRPEYARGVKGWFERRFMKITGAAAPSADRVTLLRDTDADGVADVRATLLDSTRGLRSPFGMALVGATLYVANTDAVLAFPYEPGATRIAASPRTVVRLPAGPINQHWTRGLLASPDGRTLWVSVGSASNVAEHGLAEEEGRAAIWAADVETGAARVLASGLRNPVGMAWEPERGALWTAVNERDELGGDLVPDYMTSVREGAFYGWPWSWFGGHVDPRLRPLSAAAEALVARAVVPDYALGPHTASLGLAHAPAGTLGRATAGMYVGQHGSWNRKPLSGYRVVHVPFASGAPSGMPEDVLAGFLNDRGEALGRPVGVALDGRGGLLVADDVGGAVWRVTAEGAR